MTHRERILALVHGEPLDRVPFVMYDGILPRAEVLPFVGVDRIGLLRWSNVHKVETPHCHTTCETYFVDGARWQRTRLHTPKGTLVEERIFEPEFESSSVRKHFVERPEDYDILWAYLEDAVILEDYQRYARDVRELGDLGVPLVAIERTPYQQLWVQWVGLDHLAFHFADAPDRVAHTVDLLRARAERIFEIAVRSPAPFIDFPDNITAPAVGPRKFREYCVPFYNRLAELIDDSNRPVYVHMDGDLKSLWSLISASAVGGIDSFAPSPDNDTTVAEAVALWPDKRLWINFPSSVHLRGYDGVRGEAEAILAAGGHSGRLQIQISENVPLRVWRATLPAIADAVDAFGKP
jgi:hypothetical protein